MTTKKQITANQANAQKSTGPKTAAGKAVVASNALTHGILSKRLFLDGENPAEFDSLMKDLMQALRPVGALEMLLVEKIAVALWKQRRLVAAETAMLEIGKHMHLTANREHIRVAAGMSMSDEIAEADLIPLSNEDNLQMEFCLKMLDQFELIPHEVIAKADLEVVAEVAPVVYKQLRQEADEEELGIEDYLRIVDGFRVWIYELRNWCSVTLKRLHNRPVVQSIAKLIQAQKSSPIGHDALMRYQIALDGELYRAMEGLRKQQTFRLRHGIEVEGSAELVS